MDLVLLQTLVIVTDIVDRVRNISHHIRDNWTTLSLEEIEPLERSVRQAEYLSRVLVDVAATVGDVIDIIDRQNSNGDPPHSTNNDDHPPSLNYNDGYPPSPNDNGNPPPNNSFNAPPPSNSFNAPPPNNSINAPPPDNNINAPPPNNNINAPPPPPPPNDDFNAPPARNDEYWYGDPYYDDNGPQPMDWLYLRDYWREPIIYACQPFSYDSAIFPPIQAFVPGYSYICSRTEPFIVLENTRDQSYILLHDQFRY